MSLGFDNIPTNIIKENGKDVFWTFMDLKNHIDMVCGRYLVCNESEENW